MPSLCYGTFTDRSVLRIPFLFSNKGSSGSVTQWRQISFLWLVMALPRESHSWKIRSKNKSVYENAVTGMWGSCTHQVMDPWKKNSQNLLLTAFIAWWRSAAPCGIWHCPMHAQWLVSSLAISWARGWCWWHWGRTYVTHHLGHHWEIPTLRGIIWEVPWYVWQRCCSVLVWT